MDGYGEMIKTKTWAALKKAEEAIFEIRATLEADKMADLGEEFQARLELGKLENRLRGHFKYANKHRSS